MTTILQDYFSNKLVEAGFPDDLTIEYSLSYCQGDGMAFYGELPWDSWIELYKCINPNKTEKEYRRFAFLCEYIADNERYNNQVGISRNGFGNRYSHWNTMVLEASQADYFDLKHIRAKDRARLCALWDEFISDLAIYIQDTSKELERVGYRIIESADVDDDDKLKTFNTANYRIEFKVEPYPFYASWSAEEFGYESAEQLCKDAMYGVKFADLTAIVYQKELGIKMGESSLGYCIYDSNDKSYAGNRRYLIHDAICEARAFAQRATVVANQLRQPATH